MGQAVLGCCSASAIAPAAGVHSETYPLLEGDQGTEQTIRLIRRAVRESLVDPAVRQTVARILQGVPAHDDLAEARRIYSWVLSNIRYTKDPVDHETVSNARWTLLHRIGDCDDINGVLLPSLLMTAGHPVRLVTIANIPNAPETFTHIYAEVQINGRWIPVDAARLNAAFGKEPGNFYRKRVWDLIEDRFQDVAGLSGTAVRLGGWVEDFMSIVRTGTDAANQVIAQWRGVPYYPPPTGPGVTATGTQLPGGGYQVTAQSSGLSTNTLLLLGGGAVVLLFLARK